MAPLEAAIRITEEELSKVDETLQNLGLEISHQKTKLMVLSPNNRHFYKIGRGKRENDRDDR